MSAKGERLLARRLPRRVARNPARPAVPAGRVPAVSVPAVSLYECRVPGGAGLVREDLKLPAESPRRHPTLYARDRRTCPKPSTGALLARKIRIAVHRLDRSDAILARTEAALLAGLKAEKKYQSLGFSCFAGLTREQFQMAPRTAVERLDLDAVCRASSAMESALFMGHLSASQVVALVPLLRKEPPGAEDVQTVARMLPLLRTLGKLSVRELRARARRACRVRPGCLGPHSSGGSADAAAAASIPGETDPVETAIPWWLAALLAESPDPGGPEGRDGTDGEQTATGAGPAGPEEEFQRVSFSSPAPVRLLWEEAIDCARKVLGWDAPRHLCVEAILVEAAPEAIALAEEAKATALARARSGAHSAVARSASGRLSRRLLSPRLSPRPSGTGSREFRRRLLRQARSRAKRNVALARAHVREVASLADRGSAVDPEDAVLRIQQIHRLSRPGRALLARLLRDLYKGDLLPELGYDSLERFCAVELRVSEPTTRSLCRQGEIFEDCPELEEAFATGRIGVGMAVRLWRLAGINPLLPWDPKSPLARFLCRCGEVSHQQLDRECRFFERLRDFSPSLASRCRGPFPNPEIEETLRGELGALGWDEEWVSRVLAEVEGKRRERSGASTGGQEASGNPCAWSDGASLEAVAESAEIALEPGMEADPACNPDLMLKLENLLSLLILGSCEEAVLEGVPAASAEVGSAGAPRCPKNGAQPGSLVFALLQGGEAHPATSKTSACLAVPKGDLMVTPALRGWSRTSFAAPTPVAEHWKAAVRLFQHPERPLEPSDPHSRQSDPCSRPSDNTSEAIPGRRELLPVWAAVSRILYNALEEWHHHDPEHIPTQHDVLTRDNYRCSVPGCHRRAMLEGHHVRYGLQPKDNRLFNRTALCWRHHRLLHAGIISVTGRAPFPLFWKIGRPGSKVRLYFIGQRRTHTDPSG